MPPKKPTGKETVADDAFKGVSLPIGDPRTLVLALDSLEVEVAGKACDAIEAFSAGADKNKTAVVEIGVFPPLVRLLSHESSDLRNQSSKALATITSVLDARIALRKSGLDYIRPLRALLEASQSPIGQENSCHVLSNLVSEYSSRVQILQGDVFPLIVKHLGAPQPDIVKYASKCTLALMCEYDARAALAELTGIPAVLALLDSTYNEIQQIGLAILGAAAKNEATRRTIYDLGGLVKILGFVANPEYHASHRVALEALASILQDPDALARMSETAPATKEAPNPVAPVTLLIKFMGAADADVRAQAMLCVARAAQTADSRRLLLDFKAEAALVPQLTPADPKQPINVPVSTATCQALAALAQGKTNAEVLGGLQVMAQLAKLLANPDVGLLTKATLALAVLLADVATNRKLFLDTNSLARILDLLQSSTPAIRANAASCIASLAKGADSMQALRDKSPTTHLLAALREEHVALQTAALSALGFLFRDAQFRKEGVEQGAAAVLVALLGSPEHEVRKGTGRALAAAAVDPAFSTALANAGVLEALVRAENMLTHSSEFLREARHRVLKANLSQKYGTTGVLDVTDRIQGVFYDVGQLKADQSLPSLETLRAQEVNAGRATLLVQVGKDAPLDALVTSAKGACAGASLEAQAAVVAQLVSAHMGGDVPQSRMGASGVELATVTLKKQVKSNVLPLGSVREGTYYHRALLFKTVCDQVAVDSMLLRGQYGRAYNIIFTPAPCVVDVMHSAGQLIPVDVDALKAGANPFAADTRDR